MPGIFGIFSVRPMIGLPALSSAMSARLKHFPWYIEAAHVDAADGVALGRVSLGSAQTQPGIFHSLDRSLMAVMDGEIYEQDKRTGSRALAKSGLGEGCSGGDFLEGLKSGGKAFIAGIHGSFAVAVWEERTRRLQLINDRFGMRPLYYVKLPGRLLFASEIKALLCDHEVSRGIDPRGLAQFLSFGQLISEDTLIRDVRVLPAAGWLTYDVGANRLTVDRYWRLESGPISGRADEREALERLDQAFKCAVDRRLAGSRPLGLSLSGGMDSRTILAAIDHSRVHIQTVTLGIEGSIDLRAAERMARITGCRHHSHTLDHSFLSRYDEHLRRMVHLTDGHYLDQCIVMPTLPLYRELGIGALLRGHAGELMHMDRAYNFSLDREAFALRTTADLEQWADRRLRTYLWPGPGPRLEIIPGGEMEGLARQSLRACLAESEGMEPLVHRVWQLFLGQRTRRETAMSMVIFSSVVETRLPYIDNDVVDALMAIPPRLKFSGKIQSYILRKRNPALLGVVNANTGTYLGAGPLRRLGAEARLKVLGKLGVRGYQPYERLGRWLRKELRPLVNGLLLSDSCLGRGIFNPDVVRTVVRDHLRGYSNHTFLIMAMIVFELGRLELFDEAARFPAGCGPREDAYAADLSVMSQDGGKRGRGTLDNSPHSGPLPPGAGWGEGEGIERGGPGVVT